MSLFDTLAGQALGALAGGEHHDAVTNQVSDLLGQGGNLQEVVGALQGGGLGSQVQSWVSTGANQPVAANVLLGVIQNTSWFQGIAAKTGLPPALLGPILAQVLPTVIDKLTPDGTLPKQAG